MSIIRTDDVAPARQVEPWNVSNDTSQHDAQDGDDRTTTGKGVLGGPDMGERDDILAAPGPEPHPDKDLLGGPDPAGPEDELTAPGQTAKPAPHDILDGPDPAGSEDTLRPGG